jgi:hemoglobin-like flavoprotein
VLGDRDRDLVRDTWAQVVPMSGKAADLFFDRLFAQHPDYRPLFKRDLTAQKKKLMSMLAFVVKTATDAPADWKAPVAIDDDPAFVVLALGRRHAALYHVPDEGYAAVGEALLWTLEQGLGAAFTPEVRGAWTRLYGEAANLMRVGAKSTELAMAIGVSAGARGG